MDMARMDRGLDTGRAGALGAGSGREGLGWGGRGLLEVDDTATAAAAAGATFPAAMPTFTPRAASYHNTQNQKIRPFFFFQFSNLGFRRFWWLGYTMWAVWNHLMFFVFQLFFFHFKTSAHLLQLLERMLQWRFVGKLQKCETVPLSWGTSKLQAHECNGGSKETMELTWSSQALFSLSYASFLFFSSCSFSTAARAFAWAWQVHINRQMKKNENISWVTKISKIVLMR